MGGMKMSSTMLLRRLASLRPVARNFNTTGRRNLFTKKEMPDLDVKQHGSVHGSYLPFNIHKRWKMAFVLVAYCTTGLTAPLIIIRYRILQTADQLITSSKEKMFGIA